MQGCPAGGAVSDTRRTMARSAAGVGVPAEDVPAGRAGAVLLTRQEPCPGAHNRRPPGPEAPQTVIFLEPKWEALCPSLRQELSSQSGNGQGQPSTSVTLSPRAFLPKPGGHYQQLVCHPHLETLGLGGDAARESRGAWGQESVSEAPVGRLSC